MGLWSLNVNFCASLLEMEQVELALCALRQGLCLDCRLQICYDLGVRGFVRFGFMSYGLQTTEPRTYKFDQT